MPLDLGVIASSRKENERRLPIHPGQIADLDPELRCRLFLERGYGERFNVSDSDLEGLVGGMRSREQLLHDSEVVVLPKPTAEDLTLMRHGQALWGWVHAVQDEALTELAIDRRLTLIAWEGMNHWGKDGSFGVHVFHRNNELAGYCSVLHAMQLTGITGEYGRRLRAAVISFGSTARGAISALIGMGVHDISVLTRREAAAVAAPIHEVRLITFARDPDHPGQALELDHQHESVAAFLAEHDIVVNCVLQDTDAPLTFARNEELALFGPETLFVDVSADTGMGFEWARPSSFDEPIFKLANGASNYAVDHSPSLLWNSATWEIGQALAPHLATVIAGPHAWDAEPTIHRAIEIREGVVQNPKILSFQRRAAQYPHARAEAPKAPEIPAQRATLHSRGSKE